jgi:hypothetical protein
MEVQTKAAMPMVVKNISTKEVRVWYVLFIIAIGNLLPLQRCNGIIFHIFMLTYYYSSYRHIVWNSKYKAKLSRALQSPMLNLKTEALVPAYNNVP